MCGVSTRLYPFSLVVIFDAWKKQQQLKLFGYFHNRNPTDKSISTTDSGLKLDHYWHSPAALSAPKYFIAQRN